MKRIFYIAAVICSALCITSCGDFFEEDSKYIISADDDHLTSASDTVYSVVGILNKLQAIADRTVLLGEARGDLMSVTTTTNSDLRDVAMFNIDDDNEYNSPRDYYAIINNCNYFIANVDTALQNNRNENIFKAEYAAVKAIRAWTYLQLVTTYGSVPFVLDPVLTKEESEADYPQYDIQAVCEYFLDKDGLTDLLDQDYPYYGTIKDQNSRKFFFPMRLVLGDMALWAGRYMEAAQYYYGYLTTNAGQIRYVNTGNEQASFMDSRWVNYNYTFSWVTSSRSENLTSNEVISYIPMDSVRSEGYYSQLANVFNTTEDNEYAAQLVPSQALQDLSAAQTCIYYDASTDQFITVPKNLEDHLDGDLRLQVMWEQNQNSVYNNTRYTSQLIRKYQNLYGGVRTYRRQLVYLRLAEALNRAGYPHFAFQILSSGVNKSQIAATVSPYYSQEDSVMLANNFTFPDAQFVLYTPYLTTINSSTITMGIHSRGCGYTPENEDYQMPYNDEITDPQEQITWQQEQVENLIVDEEALEFAFEGYRFYDLLRVALRRGDNSYIANKIAVRNGSDTSSGVSTDLTNPANWFLKWNNQLGYGL